MADTISRDEFLAQTKVVQEKARGRKHLECCDIFVGGKIEACPCCGIAIERNTTTSSSTSGSSDDKPKLPRKDAINDFLTILKLVDAAAEQEASVEEFVGSIKLNWDVIDNINSMKELKDLRSRKAFGALIDKFGPNEVISCAKKIIEAR